jgi:hypothetical protein
MLRLAVKLALAAAAAWAVWTFVPIGGRTLGARWQAAPGAGAFAADLFGEARRALARLVSDGQKPPPKGPPPRREARAGDRRAHDPRPAEQHTESDRRAVDRIVADRLSR